MPLSEIATIEEEGSLEDRLIRVKEQIQKATKDAIQSAGIVDPSSEQPYRSDEPNASFNLGMELFGAEVRVVEQNLRQKLSSIEEELQSVLQETGQDSRGVNNVSRSPEKLRQESEQLQIKILFLKECSSARSLLDESITLSSPSLARNGEPNLREAAQVQVQAQQALRRAQEIVAAEMKRDASSPAVRAANQILNPIQSSVRSQRVELISKAENTWQTCISLENNTLSVRVSDDLEIAYDVLETFAEDGNPALENTLWKFTSDLYHGVFQPVLESHLAGKPLTSWHFEEFEERVLESSLAKRLGLSNSDKGTVRRLEWSREDGEILGVQRESADGPSRPDLSSWKDTISFFQRIITFTSSYVLLDRPSLCQIVGKRLFGQPEATANLPNLGALGFENCCIGEDHGLLRESLLNALETTCIPLYLSPDDMGELKLLANELDAILTPFFQVVDAKQLFADERDGKLANFASSFEHKYVDKRRSTVLNQARKLLLNNDYHNTVEVGVDARPNKDDERLGLVDGLSVFELHKSSISDSAFKLMELCRKTMEEAAAQLAAPADTPLAVLPPTLYRTAREVLDLFRAIIPVTYGREIANVPRTAAVLHNDCVFLAHKCQTLGLEYKEKFPPVEQSDSRGKLLRQTCIFVDMVPLFRELAERSMSDMLDLQAKQIAELVGERIVHLGGSLRSDESVAEWSEAEGAISAGLYHLRHLTQAWKPVLSYEIRNLSVGYLADVLFSLLLDQISQASDISASACLFVGTQFEMVTKEVDELLEGDKAGSSLRDRFLAVGRFMDMSLTDIQVALSDGVFRSVSGPELSKLVTACFADSPKRKNLLKLLSTRQ